MECIITEGNREMILDIIDDYLDIIEALALIERS